MLEKKKKKKKKRRNNKNKSNRVPAALLLGPLINGALTLASSTCNHFCAAFKHE